MCRDRHAPLVHSPGTCYVYPNRRGSLTQGLRSQTWANPFQQNAQAQWYIFTTIIKIDFRLFVNFFLRMFYKFNPSQKWDSVRILNTSRWKIKKKSKLWKILRTFILRNENVKKLLTCNKNCVINKQTQYLFFVLNSLIFMKTFEFFLHFCKYTFRTKAITGKMFV